MLPLGYLPSPRMGRARNQWICTSGAQMASHALWRPYRTGYDPRHETTWNKDDAASRETLAAVYALSCLRRRSPSSFSTAPSTHLRARGVWTKTRTSMGRLLERLAETFSGTHMPMQEPAASKCHIPRSMAFFFLPSPFMAYLVPSSVPVKVKVVVRTYT